MTKYWKASIHDIIIARIRMERKLRKWNHLLWALFLSSQKPYNVISIVWCIYVYMLKDAQDDVKKIKSVELIYPYL